MSHPRNSGNHKRPLAFCRLLLHLLTLSLLACAAGGCRTADKPPGARFASVEIRGNTPGQICGMTSEVFLNEGYELMQAKPDSLVFEKKATALNNFAYGNWMDTPVWVRVRLAVVPVSDQVWRMECHAYLLRDRGETTEEEMKLTSLRSHPYQKLLDQVQKRLMSPGAIARSAP